MSRKVFATRLPDRRAAEGHPPISERIRKEEEVPTALRASGESCLKRSA